MPISGWVADRLGARTTFRTALAVFMAASIGCAFSRSLESFAAWRLVQGVGGAMMVPVGRLIILRSVPKAELVAALASLTIPSLMGPLLGPPLGGFIVTVTDWRWIFFVNIPIGVLGIVLSTIYFVDEPQERQPLDVRGFILSSIGLSGLVMGTAAAGRHVAPGWVAATAFGIGIVFSALYIRHARATPKPLLDLSLFKLATFDAGVIGGSLFRIGMGASAFLVPLMLQIGLGIDPLRAGLITLAGALGALSMKALAGRILRRVGFRQVLVANGMLAAAMIAAAALIGPATPHLAIAGLLLVNGFVRSLQFTSLHAISYADVDQRRASAATSIASVAQNVSVGFGVAIGAMVLEFSERLGGRMTPSVHDFAVALLAVALVSALSVIKMLRLPQDAGHELSGRAQARTEARTQARRRPALSPAPRPHARLECSRSVLGVRCLNAGSPTAHVVILGLVLTMPAMPPGQPPLCHPRARPEHPWLRELELR